MFAFAALVSGCCCEGGLTEGGPTPYVHCAQMEPPAPRDLSVGGTHLVVADGVVTLTSERTRLAFARGPAGCAEPLLPVLDAIDAASPAALVLVGDLGDEHGTEGLAALVSTLAQLALPVLLLPGARDDGEAVREAAGEGAIVDLSGVSEVRFGSLSLVPVPGAPEGRYALGGSACGLDATDVSRIALDEAAGPRLLLAYAGPATGDVRSAGVDGVEAGSPLITRALEAAHAAGGIYAWPEVAVGVAFDGQVPLPPGAATAALHLVVPRLLGPATEGDDGARHPTGVVVLEVAGDGVRVVTP